MKEDEATAVDDVGGLFQWVTAAGGYTHPGLCVESGSVGRGLTVSTAVAPGEVLARIPRQCMLISSVAAANDPEFREVLGGIPNRGWALQLALTWANEFVQGRESRLYPYIATLPGGEHCREFCHPWLFDPAAVAALQYPPLIRRIVRDRRELGEFCRSGGLPIGSSPDDHRLIGWGMGMAVSRALCSASSPDRAAIVPVFDLCNHSFDCNATAVGSFESAVELVATKPIPVGGEVFTNYNDFSNDDLMLKYGFVQPGNPREMTPTLVHTDVLKLAARRIGMPCTLVETRTPRQVAGLRGIKEHVRSTRRDRPEEATYVVLVLGSDGDSVEFADVDADVAMLDDDVISGEMGGWLALLILLQRSDCPGSDSDAATVRRLAWQLTAKLYELQLSAFPTTLGEDRALLADGTSATPALEAAYRYRVDKKESLHGKLATVQKIIAGFRGKPDDGVWCAAKMQIPVAPSRN